MSGCAIAGLSQNAASTPEESSPRGRLGEGGGGGGEGRGGGGGGEGEGKGRGRRGDGDIQPSVLDTEPLENPSIME